MRPHLLLAIIVYFVVAGILQAQPLRDAEATDKLVGTWVIPKESRNEALKGGETTFKADGTFTSFALLRIKDQQIRIDVQGKWKVEKGVVIEEITKSSKEQMVPVGLITRDTILELTDKAYLYRGNTGQERLNIRKAGK
jgi:hypothetical protein